MEIKSSSDYMRVTRAALSAAGFTRMESAGTVWWESFGVRRPAPPLSDSHASHVAREDQSGREGPRTPETLVLLHGVNDHAGTWFTVAPALAQRFRVILPDLPGHGESLPRSGPLAISMLVDRIAAILPQEPFTLLGNSLGGWIAMLYTLRHPERVRTLILEASGGLDRPLAVPATATNRQEADVILRAVHGPNFQAPEWVVEGLIARAEGSPLLRLAEVAEHAVDRHLGGIRVPTHIIWGAADGVLPLSYAEELQRGIPGARLHVLEGAAHIPHLQQTQRFLECLTAIS